MQAVLLLCSENVSRVGLAIFQLQSVGQKFEWNIAGAKDRSIRKVLMSHQEEPQEALVFNLINSAYSIE